MSLDKESSGVIRKILQSKGAKPSQKDKKEIQQMLQEAFCGKSTNKITALFRRLAVLSQNGVDVASTGISEETLRRLAELHQEIDEHGVSLYGRLEALKFVAGINSRVEGYLKAKDENPSGVELDEMILDNRRRFMRYFGCTKKQWFSFSWQRKNVIHNADAIGKLLCLPERRILEIRKVTERFRMGITPEYAALIEPGREDDPILIQCVPKLAEITNLGQAVAPIATHHSPARLIDQIYPQVAAVKVTNACAMYCRHCLRPHDIGFRDRFWREDAFEDALGYINENKNIRDVLLTGGDALSLTNKKLEWLLERLDGIEHVKVKRIGTRMTVTVPQRFDRGLLDILEKSGTKKPIRLVTQINTPREITCYSKKKLREVAERGIVIHDQIVLLKGVNDTENKMFRLLETLQEARVRPYYIFECSYRDPQFKHLRVPIEVGRRIIRSTIGNLSGDIRPTFIAAAGGKIPLHEDYVLGRKGRNVMLLRPWNGEEVLYPDA